MTLYKMTQLLRLSLYRMTVHGCPEYGPASGTSAQRLTKNSVRADNRSGGVYPRKITGVVPADDPRFRHSIGSIQSILFDGGCRSGYGGVRLVAVKCAH